MTVATQLQAKMRCRKVKKSRSEGLAWVAYFGSIHGDGVEYGRILHVHYLYPNNFNTCNRRSLFEII